MPLRAKLPKGSSKAALRAAKIGLIQNHKQMKLSFYRKFRRFPKWTKLSKRPQSVWVWYRGRWLKHLPQSPGRTGPTGQYSNGHVTQMISTTFSTTQATGTIHHCIMPWSSTCRVSQQPNAMVWPRELPSIRLPTARRVLPSFESSSMHPKGTKQTELRPSLQRNWSYWNHMILHNIRITHSFTIRNHLHMIIWYTYLYVAILVVVTSTKARHCEAHCSKLGEDGESAKNQKQRGSWWPKRVKDSYPITISQSADARSEQGVNTKNVKNE